MYIEKYVLVIMLKLTKYIRLILYVYQIGISFSSRNMDDI